MACRRPYVVTAPFAAVALLAAGGGLHADGIEKNAYELFAQCSSTHSSFNQGLCLGFLAGTIDMYAAAGDDRRFCLPQDFRLADAQAGYISYMQENRTARGALAVTAVVDSLARRYPCPEA